MAQDILLAINSMAISGPGTQAFSGLGLRRLRVDITMDSNVLLYLEAQDANGDWRLSASYTPPQNTPYVYDTVDEGATRFMPVTDNMRLRWALASGSSGTFSFSAIVT